MKKSKVKDRIFGEQPLNSNPVIALFQILNSKSANQKTGFQTAFQT
jgi:hypothetical protein